MEKGILHLHLTVIVIFLLTFSYKTGLLLMGNLPSLEKVRNKTKILEMVLGTLILATGVYLLVVTKNDQTYMVVKIVMVLIAIPLGIIGLKTERKLLALISWLLFLYIFGVAESRDLAFNIGRKPAANLEPEVVRGIDSLDGAIGSSTPSIIHENAQVSMENAKAIYTKLCVQCHGAEGNLKAGGAKDLSASTLTDTQKEHIIFNGKGLMAAFKYDLTEQEIKQLVQYVHGFKK